MKKLSIAVSAVALAAALLPAAASAQNIAIVNGKAVPKARFDALIEQVTKQRGQPRTPELERQIKDALVLREMFVQEAERRGMQRSPEYRAQMDNVRQDILIGMLFNDFQKPGAISDAEVQAEYDQFKAQAGGKEFHARHILVEKEEEAKALIAQLKGGASFGELAKKSSKDPGSAGNGGDLDWAAPGSYVPEFSEAMVKLAKGKYTETPVKSQFGYHVIFLEDVREAKVPSLEELKPQIVQRLQQKKLADFREKVKSGSRTDYKFESKE